MLVVYFVNYLIAGLGDEAWNVRVGWRWMFGSEALPALALLLLLFFVPESPRWLAKQGRWRGGADPDPDRRGRAGRRALAEIQDAIAQESGSLWQLLQPGMRLVLVIGRRAGRPAAGHRHQCVSLLRAGDLQGHRRPGIDAALLQTVIVGAVNLLFTVVAIWTVDASGASR